MNKLLKHAFYLILTIALMVFCTSNEVLANTLKFVQISDIHYSNTRPDNSYKLLSKSGDLLKDAISQINNEKGIKFAVLTGDSIDLPDENSLHEFFKIINTLNLPWYYTIGNHDTTTSGYLSKENLLNELNANNSYHKYKSTYYTFKPKMGYRVIVLDGAKDEGVSSNGRIPQTELQWLDKVLNKSKRDVVLIFIHFPLYPPFDSPNHEILNADELKAVLNKYKMPIAMFTGHYHMTKIVRRGNVLHVSTPSLAGYPNAFRIIKADKKRKQVTFDIRLVETNLKDIQTKAKISALGGATYYGRAADRNNCIVIKRKK